MVTTTETAVSVRVCRICGAAAVPEEIIRLEWEVWRCPHCGTVQTTVLPSVEELQLVYGPQYLDHYSAGMNVSKFKREIPKREADKVRLVRRYVSTGKLLDIGCGDGSFIARAADAGLDAVGCDYGLRSSYPSGIRVLAGDLCAPNGLPFPDSQFDVVTIWAVIEHLREPQAALNEIGRVLKPAGVMFCDTPLVGDPFERNAAAYSHWYIPPKHIHCFSARSLKMTVERSGLEVLFANPYYERNLPRWIARNGRNFLVGYLLGGALRLFANRRWRALRQTRMTQIGNIQLLIARKPPRTR